MDYSALSEFENKDIFRILFESAAEGLVLVDRSGTILMVNPRMKELFLYDDFELIGNKIEKLIPFKLREKHVHHRDAYNEHPKKRTMGVGMDLLGERKDASTFPVEVSLNYFMAGGTVLTMGLITDITERKKIERELQQLNIELEERVMARTRELANAIRDLEYSNKNLEQAQEEVKVALDKEKELSELKSRFVSTASHEFRTPLATILSSVSLIGKYDKPEDSDKRYKHIERIKGAVGTLQDILSEFLSLEKLEEGKVPNQPEHFMLPDFMDSILDQMQVVCKNGQHISYQHNGAPDTELDPKLLRNVMINLLSNAIKFSPEDSPIELTSTRDGQFLHIEVRDYGSGIAPEDQQHLFERFFRAKNTENVQGTGLGLNIVQKYVELMGGKISFKSEIGKGTTFVVAFIF